ncbi:MAG: TlpA disulfide reductase family protein [Granulosicoccus sp.]
MKIETLSGPTLFNSGLIKLRAVTTTLFCCALLAGCSPKVELSDSVRALSFNTLSGSAIAFNELNGPTLVNFWSTSCIVCVNEMPHMAELYRELSPKGFELIAVAMPYDPPNEVLELSERQQLPFPVALDLNGEAVEAFSSVQGTPTSFLIDRNGKLVERYIGALDLSKLRMAVDKLLSAS